ncbi:MAG: hypothetical protein FJX76_03095 [Armatimonadetes bacterium]|nr:hypothetical protein [Armatimonadota bacterium]
MSTTDALIAGLAAEAIPTAHGEFTLDRAKAVEKMRASQLAAPHAYVLELVQCGCLRDATRLDFSVDADDMILTFDGAPFTSQELERLDDALLLGKVPRHAQAVRKQAIALNVALFLKPNFIRVESGGYLLERKPGQPDRITRWHAPRSGTRIHVKDRLHLGLLAEMVKGAAEVSFLRERCRWSSVPIHVNGRQVSGMEFAPLGKVEIAADGVRGAAGFEAGAPGMLLLMKDGVWIESQPLAAGPLPFRAVVEGRDLTKDISQASIVHDDARKVVFEQVLAARAAAVARLCARAAREKRVLATFEEAFRQELMEVKDLARLRTGDLRALADLAVWPAATGDCRPVSFTRLLQCMDAFGVVPYSIERFRGQQLEGAPCVLYTKDWSTFEKLCGLLGGKIRNVTRRISRRPPRFIFNFGRREARVSRDYKYVQPIERGEVALGSFNEPPSLTFLREGRLLHEMWRPAGLLGIQAVVEGEFRQGSSGYGIERDANWVRAIVAVFEALPELYARLAVQAAKRPRPVARAVAAWLHVAARADAPDRFLAECGVPAGMRPKTPYTPPDLGADSDHPLAWFPWIRSGRRLLSLREIHARAKPVRYVDADKTAADDVLSLTETERGVLQCVLGAQHLVPFGSAASNTRTMDEETFLASLRDAIRGFYGVLKIPLDVAPIMLVDGAGPVVSGSDGSIFLGREHPLITEALSDDSAALKVLVHSLLVSAMNRLHLEISDHDEVRLQALLAESLACEPARSQVQSAAPPRGFLERISAEAVATGWISDALEVRLYVDDPAGRGKFVGAAMARREGNKFSLQLPAFVKDGYARRIFAYAVREGQFHELSSSPRIFCSPATWQTSPIGYLDVVEESGVVRGWTLDPNTPERSIGVHFYLDGAPGKGEFVGEVDANLPRPDVNDHRGYPGDHGFEFQIPAEHLDGLSHTLHAYGLDSAGGHNPELSGSPKTFGG